MQILPAVDIAQLGKHGMKLYTCGACRFERLSRHFPATPLYPIEKSGSCPTQTYEIEAAVGGRAEDVASAR